MDNIGFPREFAVSQFLKYYLNLCKMENFCDEGVKEVKQLSYYDRPPKKYKMKARPRKNKSHLCKPFTIRINKYNFDFLKGKNRSKYINDLVSVERHKQVEKEESESHWRNYLNGR